MINYLDIIVAKYPNCPVTVDDDPSVYENITWHSNQISKEELDSHTLEYVKNQRIKQIDRKTQELISNGFSYDNETFSLSFEAQTNWISLKLSDTDGLLNYPIQVSTLNDGLYNLESNGDLISFYNNSIETVRNRLNSGRELKLQINAAGSLEDLNNIVDSRE